MFARHASALMLFEEAERRGLAPRWETACGLFSFRSKGESVYVYYAKLHANSQLGSQICTDKSLTRAFLAREGFPSIPSCYAKRTQDVNAFFDRYQPVVQKPLLGMRSQGVRLVRKRDELDLGDLENTLFEQYIDGTEYRCLVLRETVAVQRKLPDPTDRHPWRKHITNLDPGDWPAELPSIAGSVARRLRMRLVAVDFIVGPHGVAHVLELNSMPGLHSFHHPDGGTPVPLAGLLLDSILADAGHAGRGARSGTSFSLA